jgi:ParB family chromosome partitioning protein
MKDKRLGRGLDILLGGAEESKTGDLLELDVEQIRANADQPRKEFDEEGLKELSKSILEKGVIQPIIVRKVPDGYEVVAGERRWRACRTLGIKRIPAIVRNVDERGMLEIALVENIQREDLNAIEKARGCRELVERYKITQDEVGDRLGMDRSTVSNLLRLLELPTEIQTDVSRETLSQGHARALLSLSSKDEQLRLAERIKTEGLSVRRVEGIVQRLPQIRPILRIVSGAYSEPRSVCGSAGAAVVWWSSSMGPRTWIGF